MSINSFLSNQISLSIVGFSVNQKYIAGNADTYRMCAEQPDFRYSQVHRRTWRGRTHIAQCGLTSTVPKPDRDTVHAQSSIL